MWWKNIVSKRLLSLHLATAAIILVDNHIKCYGCHPISLKLSQAASFLLVIQIIIVKTNPALNALINIPA